MTDATVRLWGKDIGAVSWLTDRGIGVFQYMPDFVGSAMELAPIMMPLSPNPYEFPALPKEAFKGLPGMLADSLPDKFGNALIDTWLAAQGRTASSFNPVERLCYIGTRGMGALEFHPTMLKAARKSNRVDINALTALANQALNNREALAGVLRGDDDREMLEEILRVGTSAGGARAKAILAWNEETGEFRSGQVKAGEGFTYWLMKFDGISNNSDKELADPQGFGVIEYAFYLLATAAGIDMSECRIHKESGRSHFMTRRFDRSASGQKLHMQSLAALRHYDFNMAGAYSYEQAVETIRLLDLPAYDVEQQFRRAAFNVLIRNQDDHVKNIAFLMNRKGEWRLSPAYDVVYAYNPGGAWTNQHQMSLNGKRDHFELSDLVAFGEFCGLKPKKADAIIRDMHSHLDNWLTYADKAGMPESEALKIHRAMRREIVIPDARKTPASKPVSDASAP
ncbi:type II toxin-antitoxin system HipA family toxin [Rhizobium nepotum]|uniref:type II toxin-antitoxin system HipA family toxin n=1 Tax=Rhizobium nepotum TaxID=1035271 RepID=UPI000A0742A2|nr:type II toxin-antitoxin system HipA family toxin [Rhizobium nepotum]